MGGKGTITVPLPVGRDGEPIHVGDRVLADGERGTVASLSLDEASWTVEVRLDSGIWTYPGPGKVEHYSFSVEDALLRFLDACVSVRAYETEGVHTHEEANCEIAVLAERFAQDIRDGLGVAE